MCCLLPEDVLTQWPNQGTLIRPSLQLHPTVFCPGFQKGRVPSEKGTFSAMNGPSKGHNYRGKLKKKGTINAVNGQ